VRKLARTDGDSTELSPDLNSRALALSSSGPRTVPADARYCVVRITVSSDVRLNAESAGDCGFGIERVRTPVYSYFELTAITCAQSGLKSGSP
jgi:hypothetical protein